MIDRFVVDGSVTMTWCFENEQTSVTQELLDTFVNGQMVVPALWMYEVVSALSVAERRKRITNAESIHFLALLDVLPIAVDRINDQRSLTRLLSLTIGSGLSAYDVAYLELAIRTGLPLATLDKQLKSAAQKMNIPVLI